MELYTNLKKYGDSMRSSSQPPGDQPGRSDGNANGVLEPDDTWVVINRNQNS